MDGIKDNTRITGPGLTLQKLLMVVRAGKAVVCNYSIFFCLNSFQTVLFCTFAFIIDTNRSSIVAVQGRWNLLMDNRSSTVIDHIFGEF